jgi:hypothetical protein
MKHIFHRILESIDSSLPKYFLVKGGRLQVAPLTPEQYDSLVSNGYEPLVETTYDELDKEILKALNELIDKLGNRAVMLYPLAVSAIISQEAKQPNTPLGAALLRSKKVRREEKESKEGRKRKKTNEEAGS